MRTLMIYAIVSLSATIHAGGDVQQGPMAPRPVSIPKGNAISTGELHRFTPIVGRNAPLPAPDRCKGWGKELNDFYGPTYYYPSEHNNYEGIHPQYYPFILPKGTTNYKKPGLYCPGKLCGSSASLWYWDSYDDWKRGERYEQHQ